MFGGGHLGCKSQLLEPHGGYFLGRSAAMLQKISLVRTQNLSFSLPKHHLQTYSKKNAHSIKIRLQPAPELVAVLQEPEGHPDSKEDQKDTQDAPGFLKFIAAAFIAPLAALVSHGFGLY